MPAGWVVSYKREQVVKIGFLVVALVGFGLASRSAGAEVTLQLHSPLIWSNEAAILEVTVKNPAPRTGRPRLPAVSDFKVVSLDGPSTQYEIINGRKSMFYKYHYQLVPLGGTTGEFTIGPVTVPVRGDKNLRSGTTVLRVYRKPKEAVLFDCKVLPPGGPVGAPFRVEYTIYFAGERGKRDDGFFSFGSQANPLGPRRLDLPILKQSNVRVNPIALLENVDVIPVRLPNSNNARVLVQESFATKDGDYGYKTLVFGFEVTPLTTGAIEVGGASVDMELFTGKTAIRRGLFGRRQEVAVPSVFTARTGPVTYQVQALPEEGRPPGFTGAVGSYRVSVTASPAEVAAFDPITLDIRVSGKGLLEALKPAAWSEIDSLTRDFQVSTDVDSGKVEGGARVFTQVLRPRSETVTAIPPVPFPFYDPTRKEYRVAYSEAVPITVRAVKTVGADAAIRSTQSTQRPVSVAPSIISHHIGIGANFQSIGEARPPVNPRKQVVSVTLATVLILPPLLFVLLIALLRFRGRDASHHKKSQALGKALAALAARPDALHLSHACEGYFRDRLELPPGEVTPVDLSAALTRQGVPPELQTSAVHLLERIHAGKFGGGQEATGALVTETQAALQELERCLRG